MTMTTFRRRNANRLAECWVDRTWQIPATGEAGSATIRLPYSSPAASSTYIDPDGGSWVEVADVGGSGKWVGIIRRLRYDVTEIELECAQPWIIFGDRVMSLPATYSEALPAGTIAWRVIRNAISGVPWFWSRYLPAESDRTIRDYEIDGDDCWSILLDLMEQCSSELVIDAETGEVKWIGALAGDLRTTTVLVAGGNLRDWAYEASGEQRICEVTVKRGSERYRLADGGAAIGYPGQAIITADGGQSLDYLAKLELSQRKGAQAAIRGGVASSLWSIRERDFVRVVVPQARFTGAEHPCRVLGRKLSDDSSLMELDLQIIDETVGVKQPPMRAGGRRSSGVRGRGSLAQRWRATQRQTWHQWLHDH